MKSKQKNKNILNVHKILHNQVIFVKLSKIYPLNDGLLREIRDHVRKPRLKTIENIAFGYKELMDTEENIENIMIWLYEEAK